MKPTTPAQIDATIAIVRAAAAGDPLDDSHAQRGHLAMVLGALDEARAEAERQGLRAAIAAAERDEARASAVRVGEECDAALRSLGRTQTALDEERRVCTKALAERDEARAALASEPARIAEAEMARDVAWVRACRESNTAQGALARVIAGRDVICRDDMEKALDVLAVVSHPCNGDADIAAAIRAARGAL